MTALKEAEVLEYVTTLQRETETLRAEATANQQTYGMYRMPELPKDLKRRDAVYILSPDVMHEEKEIRSLILTFQTQVTNLPLDRSESSGTLTEAIQKRADRIERAASVFLQRVDKDREVKEARIWRQLVTPCSIDILEMSPIMSANPAERFCWSVVNVELDGCGWLEHAGIPSVFGRQYQQFVFQTENMSQRKDGPEGPNAKLRWGGQNGTSGKWDWIASDDFSPRVTPPLSGSSKRVELTQMCWLDDCNGSGLIYLVALNRGHEGLGFGSLRIGGSKAEGKLVWSGPNPFGRVSAFITPGNKTPQRAPHDHMMPFLQEMLTVTEQQNVIDSTRASAARNRAAPRDYVAAEPEAMKEYLARNNGSMPPPVQWPEDGGSPVLLGQILEKPISIDPDLAALALTLDARRQRYEHGALSTLRDPQVLKDSTAAAFLGAWDSSMISLSPVLGASDRTDRQMIEAWEYSIGWIAAHHGPEYAKFELLATGKEYVKGKPMQAGDSTSIDHTDFEPPHEWRVNTRSRTLAQKQALLQLAIANMADLPNGRPGIGIYDELFDAADVTDREERLAVLAEEAIVFEVDDTWLMQQAMLSTQHFIEVDSGERVAFSSQDPALVAGADGASGGGLAPASGPTGVPPAGGETPADTHSAGTPPRMGHHESSPLTEAASGGSGPMITGG